MIPFELTLLKQDQALKKFFIDDVDENGEVLVGRSKDCPVRIDDRAVSRQHAVIRHSKMGFQIERKSEFAPLLINGKHCEQGFLQEGDLIEIGPYFLQVHLGVQGKALNNESSAKNPLPSLEAPAEQALEVDASPSSIQNFNAPAEALLEDPKINDSPVDLEIQNSAQAGQIPPKEQQASLSLSNEEALVDLEEAKTKVHLSSQIVAQLIFKPNEASVANYQIQDAEVILGRGEDCTVVIKDRKASRKNTLIRKDGSQYLIEDLKSANGTFVNGVQIQNAFLSGGDLIRIGEVEFQFQAINTDFLSRQREILPASAVEQPVPVVEQSFDANPQPPPESLPLQGVLLDSIPKFRSALPNGEINPNDIAGLSEKSNKKLTLLERFRALPKPVQIPVAVGLIGVMYMIAFYEETPSVPKKDAKGVKATASNAKIENTLKTFDALSLEEKKFVMSQHDLAFNSYKNRDYDKALFEIQKIFSMVNDYEDSREIERYAKEGKRKEQALEEERKRKEEEENIKKKIKEFLDSASKLMALKKYDEVEEIFSQIFSLDPENTTVADWKKEITTFRENEHLKAQEKEVQDQINQKSKMVFDEAMQLVRQKRFYESLPVFQKALDIGPSDSQLISKIRKNLNLARRKIEILRKPLLEEAQKNEDIGEYLNALRIYEQVIKINPTKKEGYAGIQRVKEIMHQRARSLFAEGLMAENYSDFGTAKKYFTEVIQSTSASEPYHQKAMRHLSRFIEFENQNRSKE